MEHAIAGIFGITLGAAGIWVCRRALKNRAATEHWNQTIGTIVERGVGQINDSVMSPPAFRYAPVIRYVYRVGDKEYVGDSIVHERIHSPERGSIEWAQKKAESFPAEVAVYYNPAAPSEAFLIRPSKAKMYLVLPWALLSLFIGLMFLLTAWV